MAHPIAFAAEWEEALGTATTAKGGPDECGDWGLIQVHGGPCGVLAALQCFVLRSLLFSRSRLRRRLQHQQQQQQQQQEQQQQEQQQQQQQQQQQRAVLELHPCSLLRQHALAEAVAAVLFQCTDSSVYTVAMVSREAAAAVDGGAAAAVDGGAAAAAAAAGGGGSSSSMDSLQFQTREILGIAEVMRFYAAHWRVLLAAPGGALSLLASVVLTRGSTRVSSLDAMPAAPPIAAATAVAAPPPPIAAPAVAVAGSAAAAAEEQSWRPFSLLLVSCCCCCCCSR